MGQGESGAPQGVEECTWNKTVVGATSWNKNPYTLKQTLLLSQGTFALHYPTHTICIPNTHYLNICHPWLFCYGLCKLLGLHLVIWILGSFSHVWFHFPVTSSVTFWLLPKFLCTSAHNSQNRSQGSRWPKKKPLTLVRILHTQVTRL